MSNEVDIVIVGGGAAGIGSARRLVQAGLKVLVLEASARIGGRAWTHHVRGLDLDLGCGWLHSADRNAWMKIARDEDLVIDRRKPAWGTQFRDLGFSPPEQVDAREAFGKWMHRLAANPPPGDRAADALDPDDPWKPYIQAIVGFISGAPLESLSIADYVAYDENSTEENWRVPIGYGTLVARALPVAAQLRLGTPVESVALSAHGVTVGTAAGAIPARAVILTVSTCVLAGNAIKLPSGLDAWREAATQLPLGRNEKLFLEVVDDRGFVEETQVFGNPREARTGAYYIRPLGLPVIECFLGGEGAQMIEQEGPLAGFAFALDQIAGLFGNDVRRRLRPLVASDWGRMDRIGGAYSYARPGRTAARSVLARPFEQRIFFAGEATSAIDFSTAHGAHDSGVRAANEVIAAI